MNNCTPKIDFCIDSPVNIRHFSTGDKAFHYLLDLFLGSLPLNSLYSNTQNGILQTKKSIKQALGQSKRCATKIYPRDFKKRLKALQSKVCGWNSTFINDLLKQCWTPERDGKAIKLSPRQLTKLAEIEASAMGGDVA